MNALNKTAVACVISAVLVFSGFFIGGMRPLGHMRAEALHVFVAGTEAHGPNSFNLLQDLKLYYSLSQNAVFVAREHLPDAPELSAVLDAQQKFERLIELEVLDIQGLSAAFSDLARAVYDLEDAMPRHDAFSRNAAEMNSLHLIIIRQAAVFNGAADGFNDMLEHAPASLFRMLNFVRPISLF